MDPEPVISAATDLAMATPALAPNAMITVRVLSPPVSVSTASGPGSWALVTCRVSHENVPRALAETTCGSYCVSGWSATAARGIGRCLGATRRNRSPSRGQNGVRGMTRSALGCARGGGREGAAQTGAAEEPATLTEGRGLY